MNYKDIINLKEISSTKDKGNIISKNKNDDYLRNILYYSLNPLITYNISEKSLRDIAEDEQKKSENYTIFDDIFDCCEKLSRLRGMDSATLAQVKELLLHYNKEERMLYIKLLSKTLRLGVTGKTVNKYMGNLIPEWEIQQAYTIEKYPLSEGEEFWITEKLNGVRATFHNGKLIARSGLEYTGLEHITDELMWLMDAGFVADGELTLLNKGNKSDNEAFRIATGIVSSDNVNKTSLCYTIFDVIPTKEFEDFNSNIKYSDRRKIMSEVSNTLQRANSKYTRVLPVLYHGNDHSKIDELLNIMVHEDKEGLMINKNVPYKRTRHKGILKVKRFYTMDLPIIKLEEGTGRLEGNLGAIVVDYLGNEVRVGSGFSDEERNKFWENKENMIGMLCEVKYKEISKDKKTGKESLQFPVYVAIRSDKNEVSYS